MSEAGMTVRKSKQCGDFTIIPKALLNDDALSWKAKGIIAYLLGKPEDWSAQVKDIANHSNDGFSVVRTGLSELRKVGYARLERIVQDGRITGWRLLISNFKEFEPSDRYFTVNLSKTPDSDFQCVENPSQENRHVTNTELTKKESTKTEDEALELKGLESETLKKTSAEEVKEAWNSVEGLPNVKILSEGRKQSVIKRLSEKEWRENWREALDAIPKSEFLMGDIPPREGKRPFKADFDWFIQRDSVAKIIEGKYEDRTRRADPVLMNYATASPRRLILTPEQEAAKKEESTRAFAKIRAGLTERGILAPKRIAT